MFVVGMEISDHRMFLLCLFVCRYVRPAPGGDLLRDGTSVLPTGRNIHALDPYRM